MRLVPHSILVGLAAVALGSCGNAGRDSPHTGAALVRDPSISDAGKVVDVPLDRHGCGIAPRAVRTGKTAAAHAASLQAAAAGVLHVQGLSSERCGSGSVGWMLVSTSKAAASPGSAKISMERVSFGEQRYADDWLISRIATDALHVTAPVDQCSPRARWRVRESARHVRIRYYRPRGESSCTLVGFTGPGPERRLALREPLGTRTIVVELPQLAPSYRRSACGWVAEAMSIADSAATGRDPPPTAADIDRLLANRVRSLPGEITPAGLILTSTSTLERQLRRYQATPASSWRTIPRAHLGVATYLRFAGVPTNGCKGRADSPAATSGEPAAWVAAGQFGQANVATFDKRKRPTAFGETAHEILAADLCPDGRTLVTLQSGPDRSRGSYASLVQFVDLRTMKTGPAVDIGIPHREGGSTSCVDSRSRSASVAVNIGQETDPWKGNDFIVGRVVDTNFKKTGRVIGFALHLTQQFAYHVNMEGTLDSINVVSGERRVGPRVAPNNAGDHIETFLSPHRSAIAVVALDFSVHRIEGLEISKGVRPDVDLTVRHDFRLRWLSPTTMLIRKGGSSLAVDLAGNVRSVNQEPGTPNLGKSARIVLEIPEPLEQRPLGQVRPRPAS